MSKVGSWSTTAGNNNSAPPDGWPEGQAPSTVNDCARELMASVRTLIADLQYIDLNNTPSYLTATTFSLATADVANFVVGRRVKLFDATTLYGTIVSVSSTEVSVQLDSGVLTSSLSSVAMGIINPTTNALPRQAYNARNLIINPVMEVWQRGPTTSVANNAVTFGPDRFSVYQGSSTAALNMTRLERAANASNVPALAQTGVFINNALAISVSAADAVITPGQYTFVSYTLEGADWRQAFLKPTHLSFWMNSNVTGTYCVAFRNFPASVSYVVNCTLTAASSWAHFNVPVPANPGSPYFWDLSAGGGLQISWCLGAGSTLQATANEWTAMNALCTSSQVNFTNAIGNTFAITAIKFQEGNSATPLELRPYGEELRACQRYYEEGQHTVIFSTKFNTEELRLTVPFKATKRAVPAVTVSAANLTNINNVLPVNAKIDGFDMRVIGSLSSTIATSDGTAWAASAEIV